MTRDEFERVAARMGMLEDWLISTLDLARVHQCPAAVVGAIEDSLRLAIAAHGQLQLEIEHPDIARG